MPIYEYRCTSCKEDFEILVMGDQNNLHCPQCDGQDVTRKLSTFASHGTEKGGSSCSGCSSKSCDSCG